MHQQVRHAQLHRLLHMPLRGMLPAHPPTSQSQPSTFSVACRPSHVLTGWKSTSAAGAGGSVAHRQELEQTGVSSCLAYRTSYLPPPLPPPEPGPECCSAPLTCIHHAHFARTLGNHLSHLVGSRRRLGMRSAAHAWLPCRCCSLVRLPSPSQRWKLRPAIDPASSHPPLHRCSSGAPCARGTGRSRCEWCGQPGRRQWVWRLRSATWRRGAGREGPLSLLTPHPALDFT